MRRVFQQLEPLSAESPDGKRQKLFNHEKERMLQTHNQKFIDGDQRLDAYNWNKIDESNNSTILSDIDKVSRRGQFRPRARNALSLPGKEQIQRNYCGTKADGISDSNKSKIIAISQK